MARFAVVSGLPVNCKQQTICSLGCCKRYGELHFIGMAESVAKPRQHTLLAQAIGAAIQEPLRQVSEGLKGMATVFYETGDFIEAQEHLKKAIAQIFAVPTELCVPDHTEVPRVRRNKDLPTYGGEDDWGIGESMA